MLACNLQPGQQAYVLHEHQIIPAKPGPEGLCTLSRLIDLLEPRPKLGTVQFDFSGLSPGDFHSWRMDYSQLCLDSSGGWPVQTGDLLSKARKAIGRTFEGWKGGDYTMGPESTIVIAEPGDPGGTYGHGYTTISGVRGSDDDTILLTEERQIP